MREVIVTIRFTRECLGFVKRPLQSGRGVIYEMPRTPGGDIRFLPSWWNSGMRYASQVVNRFHREAVAVAWSPTLEPCRTKQWRRYMPAATAASKRRYALHEAFRMGDEVSVRAVVPSGLPLTEFEHLLSICGRFKGISPYQQHDGAYGTFEVVSVRDARNADKEDLDAPSTD